MIAGVVLAAGTASRFGATKQLAEVDGRPLAQHAIDAAVAAGLEAIVVVLGHDAGVVRDSLDVPSDARVVVNTAYTRGIASSLATGLRALDVGIDAAVVLLADQPGITAAHVGALVEAYRARRAPIVRLRFRDAPGPSLLARETWDEALALEGDAGARVLVERHREWVEEVAFDADAPVDVDEPDDLGRV